VKRGDVVRVKMPGTTQQPRAHILRLSKVTGSLTVALLEDCGAYKAGATINVPPYECRLDIETR
jgi:hypothetical protein